MSDEDAVKKILVIDDDYDFREILAIYINRAGYLVFSACNGEEAKKQLELVTPDLIILDMIMPVLDGIAFLRWLGQTNKRDIPVLALTGLCKSDVESEALNLGANEVIEKPCLPDKILEGIDRLLES